MVVEPEGHWVAVLDPLVLRGEGLLHAGGVRRAEVALEDGPGLRADEDDVKVLAVDVEAGDPHLRGVPGSLTLRENVYLKS